MASVLKDLLCILSKLRFTRGLISRLILRCFKYFKSWAQFLSFLGRRLGLYPWNDVKGTFQRAEKMGHPFPTTGARLDVGRDNAVAFSSIPASARHPSLDPASTIAEPVAVQQAQLASSSGATTHPVPANLTVEPQLDHPHAYSPSVFDAGLYSNRSWVSLSKSLSSIHSRASDRLSIIQSNSYESLHSTHGQPKGNSRAAHRQFGCGPSTDRLEVSSHSRPSPSPTGVYGHRRGQSSTSVVVGIENPSTSSLARSQFGDSPPSPSQPYSIGSTTVHSSPASKHSDLPEESPQLNLRAGSSIFDFDLPDGRFLQLIISEQVPRYTKTVTV